MSDLKTYFAAARPGGDAFRCRSRGPCGAASRGSFRGVSCARRLRANPIRGGADGPVAGREFVGAGPSSTPRRSRSSPRRRSSTVSCRKRTCASSPARANPRRRSFCSRTGRRRRGGHRGAGRNLSRSRPSGQVRGDLRKLSLRNPRKSVYFAELIGKIENNIKI